MSLQQSGFLPIMWLGTYTLAYSPNTISFDQETNVAVHPILGDHEQTEPVGFTSAKVAFSGFIYNVTAGALVDLQQWMTGPFLQTLATNYANRPVGIGFFSPAAFGGSSSSQLWYSGVGYLTSSHFDFRGGYGAHKYPFRFAWIEASPVTRIPGTTSDNTTYSFSMAGLGPGFIGGVQIEGVNIQTGGVGQSISAVRDNGGTQIGSAPLLGLGGGLFSSGVNPASVTTNGFFGQALVWPLRDVNFLQSIQFPVPAGVASAYPGSQTAPPAGTFTVTFSTNFITPLPAVRLLYYKV